MNKLIETFCLVIIVLQFGFSQSKFSIGASSSIYTNFIKIDESKAVDFIDETVNSQVSYGFGLQIQYNFITPIFIRSGFNFRNFKYKHTIVGILDEGNPWNDQAWSTVKLISTKNIRIPIEIGYKLPNTSETIQYYLGTSGAIYLNLENKSTGTFFQDGMSDITLTVVDSEISESKYSIGLFAGMEYSISKNTLIGIEPYIRFNNNKSMLYLFDSEASSKKEIGLSIRLRML